MDFGQYDGPFEWLHHREALMAQHQRGVSEYLGRYLSCLVSPDFCFEWDVWGFGDYMLSFLWYK